MFYRCCLKPFLDRALAAFGLVVLSPLIGIVALIVRFRLGGPVLFRQKRIGWKEAPFWFYKFRSMTGARDARGELLPDAERLTSLGKFLRSSSLDELPQLWNVLKGDMSLVGPRPLLPEYLPLYSAVQRRRHNVRPGITGLAQVKGRNDISWQDKFGFDVWYADHQSFALDVRTLTMTLAAVVRREGISRTGHATAPAFTGNDQLSSPGDSQN